MDVEAWLKTLPLARGSKAKIRNIMSALFSHAIPWEWAEKNPMTSVRESAKRTRTPVRRSVVMMVKGAPKTEASAKDVPLDCALAESLKRFREGSTYNQHIGCSRHPG